MFSQSAYSVNENAGPAQPAIVLSNPSSTAFTIQVREAPGTATSEQTIISINSDNNFTGNDDYGPGNYPVTIPAGATRVPFNIPIVNDNIRETNETFDIIIVPGSLPNRVSRGNPPRATVTIVDDDGK